MIYFSILQTRTKSFKRYANGKLQMFIKVKRTLNISIIILLIIENEDEKIYKESGLWLGDFRNKSGKWFLISSVLMWMSLNILFIFHCQKEEVREVSLRVFSQGVIMKEERKISGLRSRFLIETYMVRKWMVHLALRKYVSLEQTVLMGAFQMSPRVIQPSYFLYRWSRTEFSRNIWDLQMTPQDYQSYFLFDSEQFFTFKENMILDQKMNNFCSKSKKKVFWK